MSGWIVTALPRSLTTIFAIVGIGLIILVQVVGIRLVQAQLDIVITQHDMLAKLYEESMDDITYFLSLSDEKRAQWQLIPSERLLKRREKAMLLEQYHRR